MTHCDILKLRREKRLAQRDEQQSLVKRRIFMNKTLIALLLTLAFSSPAFAGPKVSASFLTGQEKTASTNPSTSSQALFFGPSIGVGYEVALNDYVKFDLVGRMLNTSNNSFAVLESNGIFRVSDRFSFKGGLNASYPWSVSSAISDIAKTPGIGFQFGGEYRLNNRMSVDAQFHRTTQSTVGSVFQSGVKVGENASSFEQHSVSVGIVFRF